MKYNSKYDRYVDDDLVIYRYDKKADKLVQCKLSYHKGYLRLRVSKPNSMNISVHRLVYETFVGKIPQGYQIDHINTIRDENRLDNLRIVTQKENSNNPLTKKHYSEAKKGKTHSEFGRKFKEHFGITECENAKLYRKEYTWYRNHNNKCRWE